jgi:hypothetical protein
MINSAQKLYDFFESATFLGGNDFVMAEILSVLNTVSSGGSIFISYAPPNFSTTLGSVFAVMIASSVLRAPLLSEPAKKDSPHNH